MWVVLHEDQELWLSVGCHPLVGSQEAGDVDMLLQQRQTVDGALVGEVLPVGRAEEFDGHTALIKAATKYCTITSSTNQLPERRTDRWKQRQTCGVPQGSILDPLTFRFFMFIHFNITL